METLLSYVGIIIPPLPEGLVPYALLWLLVVIFGGCTVVSSRTVKKLRKTEYLLSKSNKDLNRQIVRDGEIIEKLEYQVDRLADIVEELDDDGDVYSPP